MRRLFYYSLRKVKKCKLNIIGHIDALRFGFYGKS